jgi:hypothetical protein
MFQWNHERETMIRYLYVRDYDRHPIGCFRIHFERTAGKGFVTVSCLHPKDRWDPREARKVCQDKIDTEEEFVFPIIMPHVDMEMLENSVDLAKIFTDHTMASLLRYHGYREWWNRVDWFSTQKALTKAIRFCWHCRAD